MNLLYLFILSLAIVTCFKLWILCSDVRRIRQRSDASRMETERVLQAQQKALEGNREEAFRLYEEAFRISVVHFYNQCACRKRPEQLWNKGYTEIAEYYIGQVRLLGGYVLDTSRFDSYEKVSAMIRPWSYSE